MGTPSRIPALKRAATPALAGGLATAPRRCGPALRPGELVIVVGCSAARADAISSSLAALGLHTIWAAGSGALVRVLRELRPSLLVLEAADSSEERLCGKAAAILSIPILFLRSAGSPVLQTPHASERAGGLLGSPDFEEIASHVSTAVSRTARPPAAAASADKPRVSLDRARFQVSADGRRVPLTRSQFRILQALMSMPGHILTRDSLADALYPDGRAVGDRAVDAHVARLRQKLERDPARPEHIVTVRGVGYRFDTA